MIHYNKSRCACIFDINNSTLDEELIEILDYLKRVGLGGKQSLIVMEDYIINKFQGSNKLTANNAIKKLVNDNLFNYGISKSNSFMINATDDTIDSVANLYFSNNQVVEEKQIEKMTEMSNILQKNDIVNLEYRATLNNTRPTHASANGIILPVDSSHWNKLKSFLSEWGCNCTIVPTDKNINEGIIRDIKQVPDYVETDVSYIDFATGKTLIFNEDIGYFKDNTPIIRRRMRDQQIR